MKLCLCLHKWWKNPLNIVSQNEFDPNVILMWRACCFSSNYILEPFLIAALNNEFCWIRNSAIWIVTFLFYTKLFTSQFFSAAHLWWKSNEPYNCELETRATAAQINVRINNSLPPFKTKRVDFHKSILWGSKTKFWVETATKRTQVYVIYCLCYELLTHFTV